MCCLMTDSFTICQTIHKSIPTACKVLKECTISTIQKKEDLKFYWPSLECMNTVRKIEVETEAEYEQRIRN